MRQIIASIGVCLVGFAAAGFFVSLRAGLYAGMFLAGMGLLADALRK